MNFKETFLKLTEYTTPFGYESELEPLLPKGWKKDSIGNYYYSIGKSDTMFTSHLDNATNKREKINHIIDGDIIKTDKSTILGGDNKAGCLVLFYLIENRIPGTYYFFIGEEMSVHNNYPHGSLLAIEEDSSKFSKFKRIISFDRKETGQLVTRQLGKNCCSDEFSDYLISEFSKNGIHYEKDRTGYYTDSAFFSDIIPEVANLSIGVWNEHTKDEYVNINYIESVAKAAININWESCPTVRKISTKYEVDTRVDIENVNLNKDQKLFRKVFTILDDLYFVCHEIRSYQNFLSKFKSNRKYHFTKWHEDVDIELSISNGIITANNQNFNTLFGFKSWLGIENMNRVKFCNLMIDAFKKGNNKLSDADFNYLLYLKGGDIDKLKVDVKRNGFNLKKIGKGYEINEARNNIYVMKHIKLFEELDFSQTYLTTTSSHLTNYYHCENCFELFKVFNEKANSCPECGSRELDILDIDSYYKNLKTRFDDSHEEIDGERSDDENTYHDLSEFGRIDPISD